MTVRWSVSSPTGAPSSVTYRTRLGLAVLGIGLCVAWIMSDPASGGSTAVIFGLFSRILGDDGETTDDSGTDATSDGDDQTPVTP